MFRFRLSCALVALASFAWADGPGILTGTARTADGAPLAHLPLRLEGASGTRTILTGPEGRYRVAGLEPGEYRLVPEAPGFTIAEPAVSVTDGETTRDLTLAAGALREHVLVAATRNETPLSTVGVSATVLDAERIDERQASSLLTLLQDVPGIATARTGGVGLQGSAFVRGGESRFARVLIDGVPVNQPGGAFDLGTALPFELAQVEIVRGAASSLYGTDALAGVFNIVTRRAGPGEGSSLRLEGEGGSFAWQRYLASANGRSQGLDWNLGLQRQRTDNEHPNSAFEQWSGALSAGAQLGGGTDLRVLARLDDGSVGTPGATAFGRPDLDASFERQDLTLGATLRNVRGAFAHTLNAGYARTQQLSKNPLDSGSYTPTFGGLQAPFAFSDFPNPLGFQNDTARLSAGYKAEWQAAPRHLLTAGVDLERETGELGSLAAAELLSPERTNYGAYLQDRVLIGQRAFLTLGGRVEKNDSYGTKAVPRAALAVRLREGEDSTTLRASAGAGIKEPSFFESFGESFYAHGNPDLKPERSRTFDLGLEQRLFEGRARAAVTAFHHTYRDQIAYFVKDFSTFEGSYTNLGETRGRGLEFELSAAPLAHVRFEAAYTFLDGEIVENASTFDPVYAVGEPLLRRPRHQGSFTAQAGSARGHVAATLVRVGERADSDFSGIGLTSNEGYTRVDLRARFDVGHGLEALATAENLFDEDYMEALGYPALGRSLRFGLRYRLGR